MALRLTSLPALPHNGRQLPGSPAPRMDQGKSLADYLGVESLDARSATGPAPLRRQTIKQFCEDILNTPEYRAFLLRRITLDALPPQIEVLFYYYAHGKPVERLEVESNPSRLENLTTAQLKSRAMRLLQMAQALHASEAEVSEQSEEAPDSAQPSANAVH